MSDNHTITLCQSVLTGHGGMCNEDVVVKAVYAGIGVVYVNVGPIYAGIGPVYAGIGAVFIKVAVRAVVCRAKGGPRECGSCQGRRGRQVLRRARCDVTVVAPASI